MPVINIPVKEWGADLADQAKRKAQEAMRQVQDAGSEAIAEQQRLAQQARDEWMKTQIDAAMAPIKEAGHAAAEGLSVLGDRVQGNLQENVGALAESPVGQAIGDTASQVGTAVQGKRGEINANLQAGPRTVGEVADIAGQAVSETPVGEAWTASQEAQTALDRRTDQERGQTYAQPGELLGEETPGPSPFFVAPTTGTKEGEAQTSELAKTATENTPGGQFMTDVARRASSNAPAMTAETPVENVAAMGGLALQNVGAPLPMSGPLSRLGQAIPGGQAALEPLAGAAMDAIPGGETSIIPGVSRDTPVLGGLTTPDEAIPLGIGALTDPDSLTDLGNAARGFRVPGAVKQAVGDAARAASSQVDGAAPKLAAGADIPIGDIPEPTKMPDMHRPVENPNTQELSGVEDFTEQMPEVHRPSSGADPNLSEPGVPAFGEEWPSPHGTPANQVRPDTPEPAAPPPEAWPSGATRPEVGQGGPGYTVERDPITGEEYENFGPLSGEERSALDDRLNGPPPERPRDEFDDWADEQGAARRRDLANRAGIDLSDVSDRDLAEVDEDGFWDLMRERRQAGAPGRIEAQRDSDTADDIMGRSGLISPAGVPEGAPSRDPRIWRDYGYNVPPVFPEGALDSGDAWLAREIAHAEGEDAPAHEARRWAARRAGVEDGLADLSDEEVAALNHEQLHREIERRTGRSIDPIQEEETDRLLRRNGLNPDDVGPEYRRQWGQNLREGRSYNDNGRPEGVTPEQWAEYERKRADFITESEAQGGKGYVSRRNPETGEAYDDFGPEAPRRPPTPEETQVANARRAEAAREGFEDVTTDDTRLASLTEKEWADSMEYRWRKREYEAGRGPWPQNPPYPDDLPQRPPGEPDAAPESPRVSSRRDILNDLDAAEPPSPASPLPSADEAAQEWLGEERRFLGTREGFADPDPALTDAQIGGMTDEEWRLAQDRRERELAEGTLRRGEDSPQPPVEPPPDEGPVSAEGMDWLEGGGMRPIGPVGDRPGQLNAGPDASPYTPLHRAEIREKFLASLVNPTRDATGVGGTAGALAGAATADEDATPEERWQRAMAGAAGGAALLGGGRYGGSRALLKLAEEGRMGMNLSSMASHPANIDRIRALMLAAADATPDGEVVRVPSMIDYLRSVMEKNPRARMDAELGLLIQDGNTPAEVRRLIAEQSDPRTVWSVGQEWLTDIVSGTNRRRVRGWEQVADRAAARASEIGAYRDSDYGAAGGWDKQDEGVQSMLDELAKFMGLDGQPVTLQVRPRDRFAGAAATRTVDGGRIVQVDSGLLRMIRSGDISEAEVLGVLAHEMGHFLPEGGVGKNLNWLEKIAGRLGTTADALAAGASEETPDAARRAARAAFRDQMLRDSGLTPSRPPRDFGEGVPSIKQMGTDVTGEEFTDIAENATKEWRYWDDLAKQNPEDAAAQQRAAHALELRNWKIEHARTLLTDPNEQTIQKAISAIDRRFDNANPKTRVPEPEARTPDAPSSRVDTPAEGTTPAPAPETTPPPTDKTPDAGLGPKPAAERQPRVYTVEELEQREVERQRRIEAREAERVAREEQRAAQRKVDQAARDMEKAVTGEERRMARETLQEAKRMEREAAQRVAAARQTWEANPGTKPTTGQMPLDMAGNEGRGAQMGLPEESGVPPLTPEQEEIAQKLREAAGKRAGKKRTEDEEAIIEAAIQEMARDQRWAAIAEGNANARGSGPRTGMPGTRDKPLLPGMEEDDLTMPARPVEGEGVEQRGLDSPTPLGPMTPAQQAAADQIAANPAKALPKQIDMGDRLKVGDWVSALRYSGLLSNVSGILSDVATGPVEGVWKLARDLVMETAGKATGRGGRPSATIMEAAAMMDSGLTEGWKLFLDTIKKPLAEGRPDKRIMEEAYKKGNRRAQRIADDVSERIARGETPDAAREAALKANPDNIIAGLMNKRTPTGESEVGRGLVRRLKAQHDAVVEAGGRVGARGKAAEVAATGIEGASRVRAGADEWNAHVAKRMENARQATHQVIEEGLNPFSKAGRARLKDLEANPTGDMLRRSQEEADYLTFRDDPGDFGNRLANLSHNPIGNFLVPMVKTGYNITRRGIERTPVLGAVSLGAEMIANKAAGKGFTAVRRGERVADQAIGTAAWMGLNQLALAGIITGSGPKDQRTRDVMYAQGWRPNSVKIGDAYHSYARLGPVAYPLALAGATGEAQLFGDDDQDASEYLGEVARNAGYWGANQLFLRSFGDLFESLRNFDTDMPRWAVNAAASYGGPLVGGGLMTGIASAADPYERIHDTWQDELRFRVPVVRNQLPARTDVFGENVRNPGAGIPGFVLPTRPGPTRRELDDKKADVRQYVGSQSAEEDLDIKQAIKADDDYYNGTGPKPTPEQRRLANRFAGRENLDYEDFIAAGRAADVERRLAG